jgi:hypothetical protein
MNGSLLLFTVALYTPQSRRLTSLRLAAWLAHALAPIGELGDGPRADATYLRSARWDAFLALPGR